MRESESITERKRSRSLPPPDVLSARRNAIPGYARFETVRRYRGE